MEEVLLSVGEQVGHGNLSFASRMNKAVVVVFLKEELHVHQLIESEVFITDLFVQVSPLSTPSTQITVSSVPSFIPNILLENEPISAAPGCWGGRYSVVGQRRSRAHG